MADTDLLFLQPEANPPPPLWEKVIVITSASRCHGYIDARGIWHRDDGSMIDDVVSWKPLD
jgi:hypothetical protein